MTVAIVTAIFGGYDKPKPPVAQTVDCTFTLITDRPINAAGWDAKVVTDTRHPRRAAKEPKLRPWRYADADTWIWVDGSFQIASPTFTAEAAACATLGQWEHPDRTSLTAEAEVSASMMKYTGVPVREQAARYLAGGHPDNWGLWCAGLIVYRQPLDQLADAWMAEIDRWGIQDQISESYALRNLGIRPESLPFTLRANPWLTWHQHRSYL